MRKLNGFLGVETHTDNITGQRTELATVDIRFFEAAVENVDEVLNYLNIVADFIPHHDRCITMMEKHRDLKTVLKRLSEAEKVRVRS